MTAGMFAITEAGAYPWSWWVLGPISVGMLGIYQLLPRPEGTSVRTGGFLAVFGLAGLMALVLGGVLLSVETVLFCLFSGVAVSGAALLVTLANPARAALAFTVVVLGVAGLFLLLAAPFLMGANIIVYAGAIVVTFLFVLMLAQQQLPNDADSRSREPFLACLAGGSALLLILLALGEDAGKLESYQEVREGRALEATRSPVAPVRRAAESDLRLDMSGVPALPADNTAFLGANLYGRHLIAVELAGVLLVVATLGAIAIAQRSGTGEAL